MTLVASRSTAFLNSEPAQVSPPKATPYQLATIESLHLRHGGQLTPVQVAYQWSGPEYAPVVVVQAGISADHHVCATAENPMPGWWSDIVGPGRTIDTRRFRVLSFDYLGGNGQTTGPRTESLQGSSFPTVSTFDQAHLLGLLLEQLGIRQVHAFVGASYGGMVGLALAQIAVVRLERLVCIAAAHRGSQLAIAWRGLQRRIIEFAQAQGHTDEGVRLARALAMTTYRSRQEFDGRFTNAPIKNGDELRFEVADYLDHCAEQFAKHFHPLAFIRLSESLDLHQVCPEAIKSRTTLIGFDNDHLVPIKDIQALAVRLPNLHQFHALDALYGHDSFLKNPQGFQQAIDAGLNAEEVLA